MVKVNVPEVLRAELRRPSWKGESVALGTNTDPYQWVEGRYKLMRGIWEAFRDYRNPCSVLTKSPLLLRDLDLMQQIAAVTDFSACLSVPTLDEKAWRATEPHTPHPRARLEAVAELNRNGHPDRRADRPAHPGHQRRARAGREDRRAGHRGQRHVHRRPDPVPVGPGPPDLHGLAPRLSPGPRAALRAPVREAAPGSHRASATRSRARRASRGCARTATWTRSAAIATASHRR